VFPFPSQAITLSSRANQPTNEAYVQQRMIFPVTFISQRKLEILKTVRLRLEIFNLELDLVQLTTKKVQLVLKLFNLTKQLQSCCKFTNFIAKNYPEKV
jgi:hypothetical protein